MEPYTPPSHRASAFHCPLCSAYADQIWHLAGTYKEPSPRRSTLSSSGVPQIERCKQVPGYSFANCRHCDGFSVWLNDRMVYPYTGSSPVPNSDMPDNIKLDYEEAREIVNRSPRGAAALLRLVVQKLCKYFGETGENINDDIASLVKKGLPEFVQQALDSVRVVGNNAVHPGQIDLNDQPETAQQLFILVNVIVTNRISEPKLVGQYFHSVLPQEARDKIAKRDGK